MSKYIFAIFIILITFFCFMISKGYIMYYRSGGKRRIIEKINLIESDEGYTTLENISPLILFLTLALEDNRFFSHIGINLRSVKEAIKVNIKKKQIVMGGSTLTQQLAKNLLFNFEKTFTRKFAELFAVAFLEITYSKEKILEVYLNCIEYGNDNWNIRSACNYYFDRLPIEIELGQAVSLISILPSPRRSNPVVNEERFYRLRTDSVNRLKSGKYLNVRECKFINESQYFEKVLFNDDIERFYREIFRNSIRGAKESKSSLKVMMDSKLTEKILAGKLCSEDLISYAYECLLNTKVCYMPRGVRKTLGKKKYYSDCNALVKSYLFGGYNYPFYEKLYDIKSSMMFYVSDCKGKIDTLPEIRGICLYISGHVGIYAGKGRVIDCNGNRIFKNGLIESNITDRNWTDWFYCPFVKYND